MGRVSAVTTDDAELMAIIGESCEDAGERPRATRWNGIALESDLGPEWVQRRSFLGTRCDDDRFKGLMERFTHGS